MSVMLMLLYFPCFWMQALHLSPIQDDNLRQLYEKVHKWYPPGLECKKKTSKRFSMTMSGELHTPPQYMRKILHMTWDWKWNRRHNAEKVTSLLKNSSIHFCYAKTRLKSYISPLLPQSTCPEAARAQRRFIDMRHTVDERSMQAAPFVRNHACD